MRPVCTEPPSLSEDVGGCSCTVTRGKLLLKCLPVYGSLSALHLYLHTSSECSTSARREGHSGIAGEAILYCYSVQYRYRVHVQ